jgi:uncharacterized membrane protein YkoI
MNRLHPSIVPLVVAVLLFAALVTVAAAATLADRDEPCPGAPAQLSLEQAQSIALAQVPGTVRESKLDCEDGRTIYEFDVQPQDGGRQMEIEIDATTGAIIKVEVD